MFVNIGRDLAAKIPRCTGNFKQFLGRNIHTNASSILLIPTDPNEIIKTIMELNNSKAAGYDDISPHVIKQVANQLAYPLSYVFNLSFETGIFPDKLKIAKVRPLFKSDDRRIMNNYRPISVLPIFSKIIEKLMHKRIYNFLDRNKSFSQSQFGF
jgi:hypothetical protein